jgi:phosphoribosyl 1,2-cyclic phosphodiesterase
VSETAQTASMTVTLWGTRGSLPAPGPETARYGGNTPCVQVTGADGTILVLDAGAGIRRLGVHLASLPDRPRRIDLLLTHLHMDHIQGLGFFGPLRDPEVEVHLWGPPSATRTLGERLARYLSPPLFPVHLRDLPRLILHEVPCGDGGFEVGPFHISAAFVCHPNPTVGYRITTAGASLCYLPDHEPALGVRGRFTSGEWVSGSDLAKGVDLLIHDGQYTDDEYATRAGWGHSSTRQMVAFADLAMVRQLVPFHHDPAHTDDDLDRMTAAAAAAAETGLKIVPGAEGQVFHLLGRSFPTV